MPGTHNLYLVYLRKSFLRTLSRMVARKPVSSRTVTQELMMENQWICDVKSGGKQLGKQEHGELVNE
jgi:hypothetical protein